MYTLIIMFFLNSNDTPYDKTIIKEDMTKVECIELSSSLMKNLQGSNYEFKCIPDEE